MSLDVGTGDGRLPYALGQHSPRRLFIGIDASAAGLRELSGRAAREGLANVVYVRAGVEQLPAQLAGVADRVTVILPWGSLLGAVALPAVPVLARLRALCQAEASLTVVLSLGERDRAEAARLGLPPIDEAHLHGDLAAGYSFAGFTLTSVRSLDREELARWPSTWARRLAHGRPRPVFHLTARAGLAPLS
ncbi:MAG TPA: class I SAM-dependent methyltransferase [Vicinamibacteria bacterium]|nr:class I SAM-dependent methyltransferase [Vicinamibacteria bacterium]